MSAAASIVYTWEGDAMRPASPAMAAKADRDFVIGETYRLAVEGDRSGASHRHYFASINEAWANLPEEVSNRFPSPEHLRRYALIRAGFCDCHTLVASSKAEAWRLAAFIEPTDEFQVVNVSEATVTRYVARSQSLRAMGRAEFEASKQAVLDVISGMIGTDAATLDRSRAL